jgi:hypothetical protein
MTNICSFGSCGVVFSSQAGTFLCQAGASAIQGTETPFCSSAACFEIWSSHFCTFPTVPQANTAAFHSIAKMGRFNAPDGIRLELVCQHIVHSTSLFL